MTLLTSSSTPSCFGSEWDPNDVDCKGGYSPSWRNADGTHTQPRCDHFDACRSRTMLSKVSAAQAQAQPRPPQLIPTQNLTRPAYQQPSYQQPSYQQPSQQKPASSVYPPPQAYQVPTPVQAPIPMAVAQPGHYYVPPSHVVPPYLMSPEPQLEGESLWAPLLRELLRGMFKSVGQTFANFWDSHTLKRPK